ncbi:MAG: hypothetical protein ACRDPT_08785, partial [Streptomycetales bacterium]
MTDAYGRASAVHPKDGVEGHLLLYPEDLVFAADRTEDAMRDRLIVEHVPARKITGVRRVPRGSHPDGTIRRPQLASWVAPRFQVDTADGPWVFQSGEARRLVEEIERRYVHTTGGRSELLTPEPDAQAGRPGQNERLDSLAPFDRE